MSQGRCANGHEVPLLGCRACVQRTQRESAAGPPGQPAEGTFVDCAPICGLPAEIAVQCSPAQLEYVLRACGFFVATHVVREYHIPPAEQQAYGIVTDPRNPVIMFRWGLPSAQEAMRAGDYATLWWRNLMDDIRREGLPKFLAFASRHEEDIRRMWRT